jgi:phosphoribosylformimino-5-aminoimidazole carboxamide ribonucleotide (ProFAR) isomerase
MPVRSFTIPLITVSNGQAQMPPEPGLSAPVVLAEPRKVVKAWIHQGARKLYIVDAEGGANHAPISAAISVSHGHALVDLESNPQSLEDVEAALATGCHHAVINATVPFLADAVKQHGKRIAAKVGVHESMMSTHATARDGSDLWSLLENLEGIGVCEYVVLNTDRHGRWRHKSLHLLAAVLESVNAPAITFGGVTHLEDLHELIALSGDGLVGCAVSDGLYKGAFNLAEAKAAIEERYDPYIWAPPDPTMPQVGDSSEDDPDRPPVSSI